MAAGRCPECRAGKHHNCTGESWDYDTDTLTSCTCSHETHDGPLLGVAYPEDSGG